MIIQSDLINIVSKAAIIGTGIVFGVNIACLAIAYSQAGEAVGIEQIGLITIILGIVGIADLVVGFVLKSRMLSPLFDKSSQPDRKTLWKYSIKVTVITASICSALPFYGLLSVFLEGNMNAMVAFAITSLAGFMLLRLRPKDYSKLKLDQQLQ